MKTCVSELGEVTQPGPVDTDGVRIAGRGVPVGEYHVDAEALRQARQGRNLNARPPYQGK